MKDIVIIGAGGLGKEIAQLVRDINTDENTWNLLGFIDETTSKQGTLVNDIPVLGGFEWLNTQDRKDIYAVCAVGNPKDKYNLIKKASPYNLKFATLIHPDARLNKYCEIGFGSIICYGSMISVNTKIGNHVCINPGCGIGHDTIIDNYTSLYWNVTLSGNVYIRQGCEIGSKAVVIQKKTVGEWSIIGAGAVIIRDMPDHCTAVGVPGKIIKIHDSPN